jgi:hypothetical protein
MTKDKAEGSLSVGKSDYVASAAKSVLGAVPFVGSLLSELAGTVIPNQRIERIAAFAVDFEKRISKLEQAHVQAQMSNENFTDLMEDGLRLVARSPSDERRKYIANLIANSLTPEHISFVESKHILRILGEINDVEMVWLRFYLHPTMGGDDEFRGKHEEILKPVGAYLGSPQADLDKNTLNNSYKEHLAQLGLLEARFQMDLGTHTPVLDRRTGSPKVQGYEITSLGRLLLREVGLDDSAR